MPPWTGTVLEALQFSILTSERDAKAEHSFVSLFEGETDIIMKDIICKRHEQLTKGHQSGLLVGH